MIFLGQLSKITDVKYSIGFIHYMPFDSVNGLGKTQAQLEQEGILIDSIPEPQILEGKSPIMYVNPMRKEIFYEYIDIPKTKEELQAEEIENLKKQLKATNQAVIELSMMLAPPM